MEPIRIQALLTPAEDKKCWGDFIASTTYDVDGQGGTLEEARESAISVVTNHLGTYARQSAPLPPPEAQLNSLEAVVSYFRKDIPPSSNIVKDETKVRSADQLLPELVFEFYRVE